MKDPKTTIQLWEMPFNLTPLIGLARSVTRIDALPVQAGLLPRAVDVALAAGN